MTTSVTSSPRTASIRRDFGGPLRIERFVGVAVGLGGVTLVVAAFLPWLSLYAGLYPMRGVDGENGQALVGLGALALVGGLLHLRRPSGAGRWSLAAIAVSCLIFAGAAVIGLLATMRSLTADPLLVAAPGAGVFVAAGAAVAMCAFVFGLPARSPEVGAPVDLIRAVLAACLAIAGAIHLVLVPSHIDEGWLGGAFLVSGALQLALAASIGDRAGPGRLFLTAAASALFALTYVAAVTVGLPGLAGVDEHGSAAANPSEVSTSPHSGGFFGEPESVGAAGLLSVGTEGLAAVLALGLVRRWRPASDPVATLPSSTATEGAE